MKNTVSRRQVRAFLLNHFVRFSKSTASQVGLMLIAGILISLTIGVSNSRIAADYGIDTAEEIGKFLDDNLPNLDPDISLDWKIVEAFPNLSFVNPIYLLQEPGTTDLWVAEHAGKIYRFENKENVTTGERQVILDITSQVKQDAVSGVKSFVFHPEYGQAGSPNENYVYIFYRYTPNPPVVDDDAYIRVSRFVVKNDGTIDKNSEFPLIHQFSTNRWHDGGDMLFDDEGFLYISFGEDTNVAKSQTLDGSLFGGILRIDVDMDVSRSHPIRRQPDNAGNMPANWEESYSQGYYIPDDNPWVSAAGDYMEEFYAVGFRAPHRMTYDEVDDQIWIGEVGEWQMEEVNILKKKANYGWPVWEGRNPGDKAGNTVLTEGDLTFSEFEYTHSEGQAIIGGHVYRGTEFANELYGKYIYADYNTRNVYSLHLDTETGEYVSTYLAKAPAGGLLGGIGKDVNNEIFLIRFAGYNTTNGKIFKLEKTTQEVSDPPTKLSDTGAFNSVTSLSPAAGVIPFDVIAPLWSDGTNKKRWFAVPNNGSYNYSHEQITFSENDNWALPSGSALIKHFEYNNRKIETRLLVRGDDSEWYGLSYRWRADQSDADLVDGDGLSETISIDGEDFEWRYPSRSECFQCHTDAAGTVLGFRTRQLNKDLFYPKSGKTANQLNSLAHIGLLGNDFDESVFDGILTAANINDNSAPVVDRVRSYLDSNCAHCHQPSGPAVALFDARLTTPLEDQGLINGPVVKSLAIENAVVIKPGNLEASIAYHRMNTLEEGVAMPPLAKHQLDEDALAVLEDWIQLLGEDPNLPVELTSFEGISDGPVIHLSWETLSEVNNAGFEVERRTQSTAFTKVGFVTGAGTTTSPRSYTFTDDAPVSNGEQLLYRLKQIDFDGRFEYSPEIAVILETPLQAALHDNYPNPFNPSTVIEYEVPALGQVSLMVYDMLGREVTTLVDADQQAGRYQVTFDAKDLPSGTYLYQLITGNTKITKKLILAK